MKRSVTISAAEYDEFRFAVYTVRLLEWRGRSDTGRHGPACPACRYVKADGHSDTCEIAAVIAADNRREMEAA